MNSDLSFVPAELNDAELARQAPAARALLIQRMERLARMAEEQLGVFDDDGRRDPRWAQILNNTSDRLERLYKLAKLSGEAEPAEAAEAVSDRLVTVLSSQFDALEAEARTKGAG